MSSEHRRAPKRQVVDITRTGAWGQVRYIHKLSCGHSESKPRAATTSSLACAWCLRAEQKNLEIKALSSPSTISPIKEEQSLSAFETGVDKMRAAIASRFSIPQDAVDITVIDENGELIIKSAVVFLSSLDVARLSKS
jgi:hypothetical protein